LSVNLGWTPGHGSLLLDLIVLPGRRQSQSHPSPNSISHPLNHLPR
jgi:hypothetical protein